MSDASDVIDDGGSFGLTNRVGEVVASQPDVKRAGIDAHVSVGVAPRRTHSQGFQDAFLLLDADAVFDVGNGAGEDDCFSGGSPGALLSPPLRQGRRVRSCSSDFHRAA